jgi:replicative DNA helicase
VTSPEDAAQAFSEARTRAACVTREFPPLVRFGAEERPTFPVDVLPYALGKWVEAAATAYQVPLDLPGLLALSAVAATCSGRYVLKVREGWREPLNLYVGVALEPASRKSAVFAVATAPILRWEANQRESQEPVRRRQQDLFDVAEARVERAKSALASASDAERVKAEAEYDAAARALDVTPHPTAVLRIVADDVTPEQLAIMMEEQGGRFAVLSAEGGLLSTLLGKRYSRSGESSIDLVLKAYSGDTILVDRVGRDRVQIERPALTIGLTIQPEILRQLGSDKMLRGRGLLARFLFAVPRPTVGRRAIAPAPIPCDVERDYVRIIDAIVSSPVRRDATGKLDPEELALARDADQLLREFEGVLEPRLGEDGDLAPIADWAGKLAGAIVRIAGLLHIADAAAQGISADLVVPSHHVEAAIALAPYLIAHARAAFTEMVEDEDHITARRIVRWIERSKKSQFTERELLRALCGSRSRVQEVEDLRAPLHLLLERGYVVIDDETDAKASSRKSAYFVNPAVLAESTGERSDSSDSSPQGQGPASDQPPRPCTPPESDAWEGTLL